MTAHVVGYASPRYGTAGLEDAFDRVLTAARAGDGPVAEITSLLSGGRTAPHGAEIVTTLDLDVQRALAAALGRARARRGHRARSAQRRRARDRRDAGVRSEYARRASGRRSSPIRASPLLDRSTQGLYPPGSTFKIVTAGDALEAGLVTPATRFNDTGGLQVGNFTVRNDQNEVTGNQDLTGAFALSSNVDFAAVALQDRRRSLVRRCRALGDRRRRSTSTSRSRATGCRPKDEVTPSVLAQLGFGQASLLVTPMRMALVDGDHRRRRAHAAALRRAQHRRHRHALWLRARNSSLRPLARRYGAQAVRDLMIAVGQARHRNGRGAAGRDRRRQDRDRDQSARPRALVVRVLRAGRGAARRRRRDRRERRLRRRRRGPDRARRLTGRA